MFRKRDITRASGILIVIAGHALGPALPSARAQGEAPWSRPSIARVVGLEGETVADGSVLTVRGSGFGSHADFSPGNASFLNAAFNNFEDKKIAGNGLAFSFRGAEKNWRLVELGPLDADALPKSRFAAQKYYGVSGLGALSHKQKNTTGAWYVSYMVRPDDLTQKIKHVRFYGDRAGGALNNVYLEVGGGVETVKGFSEAGLPGAKTQWGSPYKFQVGRWAHVEVFMSEDPSEFTVFVDGKRQWSKDNYVKHPFNGDGHTIDIGNWIQGRGSKATFDDVFIDYTFARVELANFEYFSEATKRQVQIPLAWSDGEVRFKVNAGRFKPGDRLYLFVIDENRRISGAYPLGYLAGAPRQ